MRIAAAGRVGIACWFVLAAIAVRALASGLDGFAGNWVRDARERDDAARDAEIVRVTEPMSFAFRSFARGVMRKRMVPSERYVVEHGAGAASIRNDAGLVLPLAGRAHATAKDHEVVSRLSDRGEIEQSWTEGSDSHGTTTWHLDGDGRLVVSQVVYDPHFDGPIEYSTTYRRLEQ